jgi:hypothetical protein
VVLLAFIATITWQQYEVARSPAVAALNSHPLPTTATVVKSEIDGAGGDPGLAYGYTVSGRTYEGFDIGNAKTGDVLAMRGGDHVSIIYAATMPQESCLVGSTDCPNDVLDPEFASVVFCAILIAGSLIGAVILGVTLHIGSRRRTRVPSGQSDHYCRSLRIE